MRVMHNCFEKMNWFSLIKYCCIGVATSLVGASMADAKFSDPIDTPAIISPNPTRQPLLALTDAGDRLVAAGLRGVVLVSNPKGEDWMQASVPVASDLVAIHFLNAQNGWACGHDGVILHTADGGQHWTKQLDGISARTSFEAYYNKKISAGNAGDTTFLRQVQLNYDPGPSLPWLGVWFTDDLNGYVVGSFGDIAKTNDGGRSWQPWLDHVDNPNFLNLNAIRYVGGHVYIVGEQGSVLELMPDQQKFAARSTNYTGSLFGLTGTAKTLIVFGMRGTIFRSEDQGQIWVQSTNASGATIMNGTVLADGRILLVDANGGVLMSSDDGKTFQSAMGPQAGPLADIAGTPEGDLAFAGLGGLSYEFLPGSGLARHP